jgi:glycosyltransferase involved in cell wall biosynthesis
MLIPSICIDTDLFDPARVSAERVVNLANDWRLADPIQVIMMPGRLARWKGQKVLIEALARLGRRDIRCLIIGDDQGRRRYRRELETLIKRRNLEDIVYLPGHCRDMPAAYMLSDVVVSASTEPEAFGRVSVEAQSMEKPIIASDIGGSKETILKDKSGLFFKSGDQISLVEKLKEILSFDDNTLKLMGIEGRKNVLKKFDIEKMCNSTIAEYKKLIN